jgi:hypothetical protein
MKATVWRFSGYPSEYGYKPDATLLPAEWQPLSSRYSGVWRARWFLGGGRRRANVIRYRRRRSAALAEVAADVGGYEGSIQAVLTT